MTTGRDRSGLPKRVARLPRGGCAAEYGTLVTPPFADFGEGRPVISGLPVIRPIQEHNRRDCTVRTEDSDIPRLDKRRQISRSLSASIGLTLPHLREGRGSDDIQEATAEGFRIKVPTIVPSH